MKKLLLLVIIISNVSYVTAQEGLKSGFGLSYASAIDFQAGVNAYVELGHGITDNLDVGIEWNGAVLGGYSIDRLRNSANSSLVRGIDDGALNTEVDLENLDSNVKVEAITINAFLAKAKYFFMSSEKSFRPYGGLGLGVYIKKGGEIAVDTLQGVSSLVQGILPKAKTSFGFAPELGLKWDWFVVNAKYHFAGDAYNIANSPSANNFQINLGTLFTF